MAQREGALPGTGTFLGHDLEAGAVLAKAAPRGGMASGGSTGNVFCRRWAGGTSLWDVRCREEAAGHCPCVGPACWCAAGPGLCRAPASRAQRAPGSSPLALRAYLLRASVTMRLELDYGALTLLQLQSPGTFLPDVQRWNARCARLLVSQAGGRRPACRAGPLQRGTQGCPAHCAKEDSFTDPSSASGAMAACTR